jgi:hypothetical protein
MTWVHDVQTHSPTLLVTSAEANSGKTTLAGVLGFLCYRGLQTVGLTGPVVFRSIGNWGPTLIVD